MHYKMADAADLSGVLDLQRRYHVASIAEEHRKDGFVTTLFTQEQLRRLIDEENGLFIGLEGDRVLAYAMAASWRYWSAWPMFAHMIRELPNLNYLGQTVSVENSYQYGPVCLDVSVRGTGALEGIFEFSREKMAKKYPILVTFINKINPRSYAAHTRKLGLEVIREFEFNDNHYYELVYDTSRKTPGV